MKWSSAISESPSLADAAAEVLKALRDDLGEATADLVAAFVSAEHGAQFSRVPELLRSEFPHAVVIGCSAGGVIGDGSEVEHRAGLAVTAAVLPDVDVKPFHLESSAFPDGDAPQDEWEALVGVSAEDEPDFLLMADPWSGNTDSFLRGLDFAFPSASKIGGIASGANRPGEVALFLNDDVHRSGIVGAALQGAVEVDTIVAQGCRPIGGLMQITACHENMLMGLDGGSPVEALGSLFDQLDERDQRLARHSLFLGVVMDSLNDAPKHGDFLIRNILGADHHSGTLAVGERLSEGQTVQFHLRDAETSAQDLDGLLDRYAIEHPLYEETGALLFSCLGRGEGLYGRSGHDSEMFRRKVNAMPLTGFFCNGEIGQVGGATYLHGYTSSFGVFRPKL